MVALGGEASLAELGDAYAAETTGAITASQQTALRAYLAACASRGVAPYPAEPGLVARQVRGFAVARVLGGLKPSGVATTTADLKTALRKMGHGLTE